MIGQAEAATFFPGDKATCPLPGSFFDVTEREDAVVIRFSVPSLGEIATMHMAMALLEVTERQECRCLVLDFVLVECLSSAMLAKLVKLKRKMDSKGGQFKLTNLCPRIRDTLRVTKLDQILVVG